MMAELQLPQTGLIPTLDFVFSFDDVDEALDRRVGLCQFTWTLATAPAATRSNCRQLEMTLSLSLTLI